MAAAASIRRDSDTLVFSGALVCAAVPALWAQASQAGRFARRFDLSRVERVDSAGLALLVELSRHTDNLEVTGDPPGLAELRRAYRLSPVFSFAGT